MKTLTGLNNLASNGKVGAGGALLTLILTIVVIVMELRKPNNSFYKNGDELFLSCTETGHRFYQDEKVQTFLSCTVKNSKINSWSDNINIGYLEESSTISPKDDRYKEENMLRLSDAISPYSRKTEVTQLNHMNSHSSGETELVQNYKKEITDPTLLETKYVGE